MRWASSLDLLAYQSAGLLKDRYWIVDNGLIYIYFHGLYNLWAGEYRRVHGNEPFKASSIRDYLKEEAGFVDCDYMKKIGKFGRRCVVFNLHQASDNIKQLLEQDETGQVAGSVAPVEPVGTEKNGA
jgi:hypothetical protein